MQSCLPRLQVSVGQELGGSQKEFVPDFAGQDHDVLRSDLRDDDVQQPRRRCVDYGVLMAVRETKPVGQRAR